MAILFLKKVFLKKTTWDHSLSLLRPLLRSLLLPYGCVTDGRLQPAARKAILQAFPHAMVRRSAASVSKPAPRSPAGCRPLAG